MSRTAHRFGTDIRTGIDPGSLREAARSIGADLRYWCSCGTVAACNDGEFNYADKRAVWNGPEGIEVDVVLEPLGIPCTALYSGIQAGAVTIFAPIHPGDRVLVHAPDGDLTTLVIGNILQSASNKQPLDPATHRPIFANDRLLIHTKGVPVDIRVNGTSPVSALLDGNAGTAIVTADSVKLGGPDATEPLVLGNIRQSAEQSFLSDMISAFSDLSTASSDPSSQLYPLFSGLGEAITALTTFASQLDTFLSTVSVTK